MPKSTVSSWWRGRSVPDPTQCETIAEAFQTEVDIVLIEADHRPNIENYKPGDPRIDLTAMIRRVSWNKEREAIVKAVLKAMPKSRLRDDS